MHRCLLADVAILTYANKCLSSLYNLYTAVKKMMGILAELVAQPQQAGFRCGLAAIEQYRLSSTQCRGELFGQESHSDLTAQCHCQQKQTAWQIHFYPADSHVLHLEEFVDGIKEQKKCQASNGHLATTKAFIAFAINSPFSEEKGWGHIVCSSKTAPK